MYPIFWKDIYLLAVKIRQKEEASSTFNFHQNKKEVVSINEELNDFIQIFAEPY